MARIAVVGSGAIGSYYGGKVAKTPRLEIVYALLKHVDVARQRAARGRVSDELGAFTNLTALSGQVSKGG
jgi:ketopantoate reductase